MVGLKGVAEAEQEADAGEREEAGGHGGRESTLFFMKKR
jgi:hypothetical protein